MPLLGDPGHATLIASWKKLAATLAAMAPRPKAILVVSGMH
jgi:hypothetical protein